MHPEQNTYEIKIDNESKQKGSLLEDFEPPVVPAKEIDDPSDSKPADWVDEAKIADPMAKKVRIAFHPSVLLFNTNRFALAFFFR